MGTARIDGNQVWIRCWDGTEMEYECFVKEDFDLRLSDQVLANSIGAVRDKEFTEIMKKLREDEKGS